MTGGRCQRRRNKDGGCGAENLIYRAPTEFLLEKSVNLDTGKKAPLYVDIDLYTQARKALSERSPFDFEDGQDCNSVNLPRELANLLSKHSDGRKRHKKLHPGAEAKSSRLEKSRGPNIWVETEEYFRGLSVEDVEKLDEASSLRFSGRQNCFLIPCPEKVKLCNGDINGNASDFNVEFVVKEEVKEEKEQQYMEVDSAGGTELPLVEKDCFLSKQVSGLEWLLGSRSKVHLTSERPSKKRKLLGGDAGLEKLFVASAVEGSSSLCHYCSLGDTGNQLNRLIVCSMCNVAVHQRCYGVQEDVSESWLCSWCKKRNQTEKSERPCLLCPKQGGALKLVRKRGHRSDNGECAEFAHLFCCQWMPEVYIEDTRTMEPIMNVEGIRETRLKLICHLCKMRCGACIRCSNGACRASFHPICAREAKHRMEIWGKFGCDDVELRAFCLKHSEVQNNSITQQVGDQSGPVGPDSNIIEHQPVSSTAIKPHKIKIGRRNGDKTAFHLETADMDLDRVVGSVSHEIGLSDAILNPTCQSDCGGTQLPVNADILDKRSGEDINTNDSLSFTLILKKLIDGGKVNVNDVASEIGVSPDSLVSNLDDRSVPELQCKIVEWLKNNAYIGTLQRNLKVRFKSTNVPKVEKLVADDTNVTVAESRVPDVVPVTSIPPRRRTKSNVKILKDNKVVCSSRASSNDDEVAMNDKSGHLVRDEPACQSKESLPDATQKILLEPGGSHDILARNSSKIEGDPAKPLNCTVFDDGQAEEATISDKNAIVDFSIANPISAVAMNHIPDLIKVEAFSSSYIHSSIQKTLAQMPSGVVTKLMISEYDGLRDKEVSAPGSYSSSSICCNHQSPNPASADLTSKFGVNLEQLAKARNMGILEQSPVDEVEGELIFFQQRLLQNAVSRKRFSDDLICKVLKSLPQEIDALGKQKWDAVIVNKYLCEVREVKKQGRKERRHKEAQAVLAAATAAAAASSRISSFRKDPLDESAHQDINPLKVNPYSGRATPYSQQMPRAKETLSRLAITMVSSEKNSDAVQSSLDYSKEHPRTCEICRRSETILNPILVCSSCKVAVHLDCYRSVKDSTGPWYCELCEDLSSSRSFGAPVVNSWEKPYFVAECALCGGTAGAFRKSTDGQWIHAFCAEWVLESTFKRGQANSIQGMETVSKGSDMCHICRRKQGVCIKCNYGHCQSSFHPSCARSSGYYMNLKTSGGKLQHKAYCEKHSRVERAKAETQKHGIEELKSLKPVRVELEKLRLLCERIIKREKLKRELVLCSHDILASNRDAVALSAVACSSFFPPEVSSESATTSLKGYIDGYKSGCEAIQRSDDITVDSTVAGKRRIKFPVPMDNDQKTDDSSTSQQLFTTKPSDRASFSGKQIPHRPSSVASWSYSGDGEKQSKYRKHTETFEKELVMTSDQASMRNQRLPKGFVYVPIRCLSNEKETVPDSFSQEQLKRDG